MRVILFLRVRSRTILSTMMMMMMSWNRIRLLSCNANTSSHGHWIMHYASNRIYTGFTMPGSLQFILKHSESGHGHRLVYHSPTTEPPQHFRYLFHLPKLLSITGKCVL